MDNKNMTAEWGYKTLFIYLLYGMLLESTTRFYVQQLGCGMLCRPVYPPSFNMGLFKDILPFLKTNLTRSILIDDRVCC